MPEDDGHEVILVPVARHDVNLTVDDIVTPLTQLAQRIHDDPEAAANPQLVEHVQKLSDLATQLVDVAGHINTLNPKLLDPTRLNQAPPEKNQKA